ncbi:MAG TPA: HAF repeat/PEP-CTERM domain-containing protein [Phycisphaerae bacterium]|nr:HAF repeat/PEP-CTERM domain-containing protein [Phycisphaerae bacterium]
MCANGPDSHARRSLSLVALSGPALLAACSVLLFPALAEAATFRGLGDLPGGGVESKTYGMSGDGRTVVGYSESSPYDEAFRWTDANGMVGLGDFRPTTTQPRGESWGASYNGSVVVGYAWQDAIGHLPCRWTASGDIYSLGELSGGSSFGKAMGSSADGSLIVGYASSSLGNQAFVWTDANGMVGLGDLPGGGYDSSATDVSANGSVIVGAGRSTSSGTNFTEAFRYTDANGMVGLGDLSGSLFASRAWAVSADGSVIVGEGTSTASGQNGEAFRWTQATGMVPLGDLPGGAVDSAAYDCSGDGAIIVGSGFGTSGTRAMIWDANNGMRDLSTVLTGEYGIDLTGWKLYEARAISDDGKVIAGYGQRTSTYKTEAWMVDLSAPGDAESNPILPDNTTPGSGGEWSFDEAPGGGCWFDPPSADSFLFETDGNSSFLSVQLPAGLPDADGNYTVSSVHGSFVVAAGGTYIFPSAVQSFTISGIDPAVDGEDALAFPTYLVFDQETVNFDMTPLPEPCSALALLAGLACLRRRRRTSK